MSQPAITPEILATARDIARECYVEVKGTRARRQLFRLRCIAVGIDPQLIIYLVVLAIRLWVWWRKNKISHPGQQPHDGEPTYDEQ